MAHALSSNTLAAAVRVHFGLSQAELGRYLGVTRGQVAHVEAGRRRLPALLTLRLTRLARLLPPPEGTGPPAFVPEVRSTGPPPLAPVVLVSEALLVSGPLAVEPLRQRQRQCARHLVLLRRDWH
ncbi:MAG: helix-turn-helix transcriptional regulator, partial [Hymenobacteraceae bacterium]|nr:helix-turn-helix transcriptional regulator [Hymenobacteraceae bacterium]